MILTGVDDDPRRFTLGDLKQFAYLHTVSGTDGKGWRVYRALLLNEFSVSDELWKDRRMAHLLYVDDHGKIRIEEIEHFASRISAHYWVHWHEFPILLKDIRDDHAQRGLWTDRLEDARKIEREDFTPRADEIRKAPDTSESDLAARQGR